MKTLCIVMIAVLPLVGLAQSQSDYWQQEVHYNIQVTLLDKQHSLRAEESLEYINHSPDTLSFIWFHLWPNAYKNDRTAFSEQMLQLGRTDFYFSINCC